MGFMLQREGKVCTDWPAKGMGEVAQIKEKGGEGCGVLGFLFSPGWLGLLMDFRGG